MLSSKVTKTLWDHSEIFLHAVIQLITVGRTMLASRPKQYAAKSPNVQFLQTLPKRTRISSSQDHTACRRRGGGEGSMGRWRDGRTNRHAWMGPTPQVNSKCDVLMKLSVFGTRTDTHTRQNLYILALWAVKTKSTHNSQRRLTNKTTVVSDKDWTTDLL